MELKKFKEKNPKKVGIILFTITCILLITGVILYRTFAIFQVDTTQNIINGSIEDPGDIYFAFYKDGNIQKEIPRKEEGYVLDEQESYCEVTGTNTDTIKVTMTEDEVIHVSGVATSRTKCNLYFVKGAYILGKGVPTVESGDGLYETTHKDVTGTLNDIGFQKTEYRYAGVSPNNYVTFNDETWRIIGLVNVMMDEKNTVEQRVKIVREEPISNVAYSSTLKKNDWAASSLMTLLNEEKTIKNNKEMIEEVVWTIGGYSDTSIFPFESYNYERTKVISQTNVNTWQGKVAIIYPSDYTYAVGGENRKNCINDTYVTNYDNCTQDVWLNSQNFEWLLMYTTTQEYLGDFVFELNPNGKIHCLFYGIGDTNHQSRPTLYLKSNVKITNGNGTEENPWILSKINL